MKYPSAWADKPVSAPTIASKVEARIDMSAEVAGVGKCPACKKPMQIVTSMGSKVWACVADQITLPLPDGYEEKN